MSSRLWMQFNGDAGSKVAGALARRGAASWYSALRVAPARARRRCGRGYGGGGPDAPRRGGALLPFSFPLLCFFLCFPPFCTSRYVATQEGEKTLRGWLCEGKRQPWDLITRGLGFVGHRRRCGTGGWAARMRKTARFSWRGAHPEPPAQKRRSRRG